MRFLAELPKLNAEERSQVFARLCELQEADLMRGVGQTAEEKRMLDEAAAEYQRDGDRGMEWREALREISAAEVG